MSHIRTALVTSVGVALLFLGVDNAWARKKDTKKGNAASAQTAQPPGADKKEGAPGNAPVEPKKEEVPNPQADAPPSGGGW